YIFIAGLLALLALGVHVLILGAGTFGRGLENVSLTADFFNVIPDYWNDLNRVVLSHPEMFVLPFVGLLATFLLLSWRVDINQFSMHLYYRNRLARCYLGASNCDARTPQPFTGFDPTDDIPL